MATQWTAGLSAGQVLNASTLNTIGAAWETWTPALTASTTNPTLGTGSTAAGRYGRIQKTVFGQFTIAFGSSGTNAGSGFYFVSLPVSAQSGSTVVGQGYAFDNSASLVLHVVAITDTVNRIGLWIDNSTNFALSSGNPWPWGALDVIRVNFEYEAA